MIKVFLIFVLLQFNTLMARQIVLVIADDFNSSKARLFGFEGSKTVFSNIDVNLGRSGLAWGVKEKDFIHKGAEPSKYEGDGKSPAGIFPISRSFGYGENVFLLPYIKSTPSTICVDDVKSSFYNKIIDMQKERPDSFEFMKRDDEQYKIGAVVEYNANAVKGRGSCIFLHVQKEPGHPTSGCTSMRYGDLQKILQWLDPNKDPILVQVPKEYLDEVFKQFPQISSKKIISTIK
ncbi:L,D-transpeptidase family protein [Sulfurimonas sp. HSL3-2]|uniref:L,D-transpeptidase family protein n=1 Tax=Hydrocurvibacter mobilis TaxID=3131936 RepID=UPI0031F90084